MLLPLAITGMEAEDEAEDDYIYPLVQSLFDQIEDLQAQVFALNVKC